MTKVNYEITLPNGNKVNEVSYQKTLAVIAENGGHFKIVYTPIVENFPKRNWNYKMGWFRQ